jgi:hypothetical protein
MNHVPQDGGRGESADLQFKGRSVAVQSGRGRSGGKISYCGELKLFRATAR